MSGVNALNVFWLQIWYTQENAFWSIPGHLPSYLIRSVNGYVSWLAFQYFLNTADNTFFFSLKEVACGKVFPYIMSVIH